MWVQVPSSAPNADMAELADALDSGSSDFTVIQVQVLLSAPKETNKPGGACLSLFIPHKAKATGQGRPPFIAL